MQNLDSVFAGAEKSAPNPFRNDVFAPGANDLPGVAEIHSDVLSYCVKAFEALLRESRNASAPWGTSGRTILIAAPRAGYGKSHLVGRIRSVTESLVTAVSLPFDPIRSISWETFLESLINQYRSTRCPQNLGCTLFDETSRFFQSQCVRLAMENGALDEKEVPESEVAMRVQFRDVFDPKTGTRLISWYGKRSPEILDAASNALCQRWSLTFEDLVFWNRFFQEHARPKADPFAQLLELSAADARQRLMEFLRIATDCRPAAFVADHLDGFFGSNTAGMEITRILTTLRDEVPRSVTLVCLNEDLWQSLFEGKIPTAWIDRLTGEAVPLKETSIESAEFLLLSRLHAAGITGQGAAGFVRFFRDRQGWDREASESPIYPREVLREAAKIWDDSSRSPGSIQSPAPASAPSETEGSSGKPFVQAPEKPTSAPRRTVPGIPPARPVQPSIPGSRIPAVNDDAAAARAAGRDVTHGPADIEALISDIRGGGARTMSETAQTARSRSIPPPANRLNGNRSTDPDAGSAGKACTDRNPFWAKNLENRLQELESGSLGGQQPIRWEPERIEYLIRSVGERFPAVAQTEKRVGGPEGGTCLRWIVRNFKVLLGFEPPSNLLFWKALLQQAESMCETETRKISVFSHPAAPFDFRALSGIGTDSATVLRYFDVIEMTESDLRRLYAAERFLREAAAADQADAAVRVIARRLDSFWRRLTRPLTSIETT